MRGFRWTSRESGGVKLCASELCHPDKSETIRRRVDGLCFSGYSQVKDQLPDNPGRAGIGTPDQLREHLARYEKAGIDQVMFVQQAGANRHEHISESLEVFAERVMPEFKAGDEVHEAKKRRELAPFIEAALARKPKMAPIDDAAIPRVEAFGPKAPSPVLNSDRGRAIPIPTRDPLELQESGRE